MPYEFFFVGMTSLTGFRLDDMFEPLSVFSVYLSGSLSTLGIIQFVEYIDFGSDWDSTRTVDHYSVLTSGLYFFALKTGASSSNGHAVTICVNGVALAELRTTSTNNAGLEVCFCY